MSKKAGVSLEKNNVLVEYDPSAASPEETKKAVAEMDLGYEVTGYKEIKLA